MRIFSAAFFGGTLLLLWLPALPDGTVLAKALSGWGLWVLLLYLPVRRWRHSMGFLAGMGGLGIGAVYALLVAMQVQESQLPPAWEGEDILLQGKVVSVPEVRVDGQRFLFEVEQKDFTGRLRLAWYGDDRTEIRAGECWQLRVRAKRPNGFINQAGFDYEKWLFSQRIGGTGYVRKSTDNRRLKASFPLYPDNIRQHLGERIRAALGDSPVTGLVQGLAVAYRSDISDAQWDVLRRTGTSHLLAISGLHIGMVAGFGFLPAWLIWRLFPALYLWLPVRIAGGLLGGVMACGYALLAGFTVPTQRALAMVLVLMLGLLLRRRIPFSVTFSLALLLVLLIDPLASLSVGFWLSFLAVALLAFLAQRRHRQGKSVFIRAQLGLSVGMLPLTAGFFGAVSLVSPLANLLAIPYVTLLVAPLVLSGVLLSGIFPWLAAILWQAAGLLLEGLMHFLGWLAGFEWSSVYLPLIPWYWLLAAMAGFAWLWLPSGMPGRWLGLVLLLPLPLFQPDRPEPGAFRVSVLDVGQGLASVVQTRRHTLLFDTGPRVSGHFDTGELVILPWLRGQGVGQIDHLLVSHQDNDHRGGVEAVMAEIPVKRVMVNEAGMLGEVDADICEAGQSWQWDGVSFEILHPDRRFSGFKRNDRSCVLRVSSQYHSMLFTADIGRPAEKWLLQQEYTLKSEVLLVPHHGSKTSSSPAFIDAVMPQLAIVTSGYRNRFHHPHPSVSKRYQARDIELLNTADTGELTLDFPASDAALGIFRQRMENRHFWSRVSEK